MAATIIIPTYNAFEFTKKCLASLKRTTVYPYKLIVVDNGSTDGTREWLEQQKDITLIKTKKNLGYAGACNMGLAESNSEYIVLSNNDLLFTPYWLTHFIEATKINPRIGLVGPITNNAAGDHRELFRSYHNDNEMFVQAAELRKRNFGFIKEVPWLVFFLVLIKRSVVDILGPLDDSFGLGGHDDLDYSKRASDAGFCCVLDRSVFVHHFCSVTYHSNHMDYNKLLIEARQKFCSKWNLTDSDL